MWGERGERELRRREREGGREERENILYVGRPVFLSDQVHTLPVAVDQPFAHH